MIKCENVISILRFYESENPSDFEDYVAVCNIVYENKNTIWIKGLQGSLSRKMLRELLCFLINNEIETVKVYRSERHKIPLGNKVDKNLYVINTTDLAERFLKGQ